MRKLVRFMVLLAFVSSGILAWQGFEAWLALGKKADEQLALIDKINHWHDEMKKYAAVPAQWNATFGARSDLKDIASVAQAIGLRDAGLIAPDESIRLKDRIGDKATQDAINGLATLGLAAICVDSSNNGVKVQAGSFDALISGIDKIARRKDLIFDRVQLISETEVPTGFIGNLCLLTRVD